MLIKPITLEMIKYSIHFISIFTLICLASCYKDEIKFTPDLSNQNNIQEFLTQFIDVSTYYQYSVGPQNEVISLINGHLLEIPSQSLKDRNGKSIDSGKVTVKVTILESKSDFMFAPSLQSEGKILIADKCFSLTFLHEGFPVQLTAPFNIYMPANNNDNSHVLKLWGHDSGPSSNGWNEIVTNSYTLNYGIWQINETATFKGVKFSTSNTMSWFCLGQSIEKSYRNKKSIIVHTDEGLSNKNSLVYFVPQNENSAIRLEYDPSNRLFLINIETPYDVLHGHIVVLSDKGSGQNAFALSETQLTDEITEIKLFTTIKSREEINEALNSL